MTRCWRSMEVIARVAAFLKRAENDPGLKFEVAGS
jgi:hypothetical protein